ncbi:MAG: MotA/TolQ/ExbB proton channel family protein [Paludibacteraceae bacterium]|nr:MotA/TolQ/ExbB proton channel family protein [Paludibacteraceae bacterium]
MKKVFAVFAIVGAMLTSNVAAQEADENTEAQTEQVAEQAEEAAAPAAEETKAAAPAAAADEDQSLHHSLKQKFIEGGVPYMGAVFICLILGLALSIERILYLSLSSVNTKKLLTGIESALAENDVEKAKDICRNTRGPIASIFYQGLMRVDDGVEMVEKTVTSYGSVQMGQLDKNVTWISLCIALAPMLGFMGTVFGMIQAFDKIQQVGDISATVVAGGIKVSLLTTVGGLIVAMILQVFLNFILVKIEGMTTEMEDASISLLDIIVKHEEEGKVAAQSNETAPVVAE